ncbi:porin [Paraburkholderia sp. BCC1885]|uniref:porin n=1 Tax=Paraburkholderia sp. BCC1885 TaxID=2562669 RepID=UPI0011822744|nr:porin [Paraburkholderia sp. BCC1885]
MALRKLMAASLFALTPLVAYSQSSVILYGIVDTGVIYKTGANKTGQHVISTSSGIDQSDRLGFKGVEDLGGGFKAIFQLETGFLNTTGVGTNGGVPAATSSVLFDRGALVGLSSDRYGEVTFGRLYTPFQLSLVASDASGFSNFGSMNTVCWQGASGFSGWQCYWANNAVKYVSPRIHGLTASAMYSEGGKAGDIQNQRERSASLNYVSGPVALTAAYLDANDPSGLTDNLVRRSFNLGGVYRLSALTAVGAAFTALRNPSTGESQDWIAITGQYGVAADVALTFAYLRLQDRQDSHRSGNSFKIGANYLLSKRTTIYADLGYTLNASAGTLGLQNAAPSGGPGINQFAAAIGVRTSF